MCGPLMASHGMASHADTAVGFGCVTGCVTLQEAEVCVLCGCDFTEATAKLQRLLLHVCFIKSKALQAASCLLGTALRSAH
jgi:hypothetical protein